MTRVHEVKKSQKDYPDFGIKKGETYYWWSFNFGPTYKSKTYPKRSQLTQSSFLSSLYEIQDSINFDREDLEGSRDILVDKIGDLRDECQNNLDNMPQHLQETSSSGETLQERISALDDWINGLEGVDVEIDEELKDEERESRIDEIIGELEGCELAL